MRAKAEKQAAADDEVDTQAQRHTSHVKQRSMQHDTSPTMDWKKYLIPDPPKFGRPSVTPPAAEHQQREETPDSDWSERRKRFTRSRTNPEFVLTGLASTRPTTTGSADATTTSNTTAVAPYRSRYLNESVATEMRRARFVNQDSNESSIDNDSSNGRAERRARYQRRKSDRSHTTLHSVCYLPICFY